MLKPATSSFPRGRLLAVLSFIIALSGQTLHFLLEPERLYVAYAPHPLFVLVLFVLQTLAHAAWLSDLFAREPFPALPTTVKANGIANGVDGAMSFARGTNSGFKSHAPNAAPLYEERLDSAPAVRPLHSLRPGLAKWHSFDSEAAYRSMKAKHGAGSDATDERQAAVRRPEVAHLEFIPVYVIGNLCLAGWSLAWVAENLLVCQILLVTAILSQYYTLVFIFRAPRNWEFTHKDYLMYLLVKPQIGTAVLLLCKTWGTIVTLPPPTIAFQAVCCAILILMLLIAGPDPTLALFLIYDLAALACGPHPSVHADWHDAFIHMALAVGLFAAGDWAWTVLVKRDAGAAAEAMGSFMELRRRIRMGWLRKRRA